MLIFGVDFSDMRDDKIIINFFQGYLFGQQKHISKFIKNTI